MVLPILNQQLKHLKYLKDQPDNVSIEICKLVLEFLGKRQNINKYTAIAEKLNTTKDNLELTMQAVILLVIKSIQNNIVKSDFEQAMYVIFTASQTAIFWEFICSQKNFMKNILACYNVTNLRYRDLEWRVEARIASRCLIAQAVPIITIKLYIDSEELVPNRDSLLDKQASFSEDLRKLRKKEILFQTDPTNLLHIIGVLEQALEESKTHRTKNFVKAIQL